jgi:hypothetical protein
MRWRTRAPSRRDASGRGLGHWEGVATALVQVDGVVAGARSSPWARIGTSPRCSSKDTSRTRCRGPGSRAAKFPPPPPPPRVPRHGIQRGQQPRSRCVAAGQSSLIATLLQPCPIPPPSSRAALRAGSSNSLTQTGPAHVPAVTATVDAPDTFERLFEGAEM